MKTKLYLALIFDNYIIRQLYLNSCLFLITKEKNTMKV